ncbi:uncharacterized protein [Rutidosis leptorrhynchoides]|uniref:uncharacterized protein n=1 Tax=Rutidosis leptorrhynchoides TaxID=125765 RepID=UPI003A99B0C0
MARQKSRVKWALEGDENTKYFHSFIKRRHSKRNIRGLNVRGGWTDDPTIIKQEVFRHFKAQFEKRNENKMKLAACTLNDTDQALLLCLSNDQSSALEGIFTEKEVFEAISECSCSKAPVPDGFNFKFFKMHWELIKQDLINALIRLVKIARSHTVATPSARVNSQFGLGVLKSEVEYLENKVSCKVGEFPFIYVGLPIGRNMNRIESWKPVIEKYNSRLANWKARMVSYGGRLTLIKSVLSSLPLYFFSLFRAPLSVIDNLECIRRKFFWGGTSEGSKLSWVKWDEALLPYGEGGHNIGSLRGKNLALLGKWFWRIKTEPNLLWVAVLKSIHISNGLLPPLGLNRPKGKSGVWFNILRAGYDIEKLGINFASSFMNSFGNGAETKFWEDP